MVAKAAYEIAQRTTEIDKHLAYQCGMLHDVGKLYLPSEESYKHPYLGYEIMQKNSEYFVAQICVSHAFPVFAAEDYLEYYCHGDRAEIKKIKGALANVERNIYIELIQFCDKISGVNSFMSLDEKFTLYKYKKNKTIDDNVAEAIKRNYSVLSQIKGRLDEMIQDDVYLVLKSI
jgi:HD superfamily phosphodiesterase